MPDDGAEPDVFESAAKPTWEKSLAGPVELVAAGGDLVTAKTGPDVSALDAKTGQPRWTYNRLAAESLAVGPDGAVYITVKVPREEAMKGDWAKYPRYIITEHGFAMPGEPILTLLQLDGKTGKASWGIKNIGRELLFTEDEVFAFDQVGRLQLLDSHGLMAGSYRVTCLSRRDGKQRWFYGKEGSDLVHYELVGDGVFLAGTEAEAFGRMESASKYELQILKRK